VARASITPSRAWTTPPAFRAALTRFPTWDADWTADLTTVRVRDLGDIRGDESDPTPAAAHERLEMALLNLEEPVVVVVGGDNSLTRPALLGLSGGHLDSEWGLLTLDAHHDVRPATDGPRNGTVVRDLVEAGLPGARVAQVGIHGQGNAREHAVWAADTGIHVYSAARVRREGIVAVIGAALTALTAAGAERIYADLDLDLLDRAHAPACPASLPGGLLPVDLLEAAALLGRDPRVAAIDLVEVDAAADVNGITVRCLTAAFLAFCAGYANRPGRPPAPPPEESEEDDENAEEEDEET
jgi:formiminoglutamase